MKCKAYAKINLTLDVTGRREDGFHTLDTVMQTVSLWDEVELLRREEPGVVVRTDREYLPTDMKNTAYKAAVVFFRRRGLSDEGVEIVLEKHIPTRAGLGGGSTDAAAVLRGLNRLYGGLTREELITLGAEVGADVPFCVHGGTCRCGGVGELLEPVSPMPPCFLVICKPPAGMSTPRAYALLDRRPLSQQRKTPGMVKALGKGDLRAVAERLSNRFDEVMKLREVREIEKIMLSSGALGAMMSGSGSAVYGVFTTEQKAENCAGFLKKRGEVFLARPMEDCWEEEQ